MKILFYMRAVRQLRPYKSVISELSKRGHSILVVFDPREKEKFSTETVDIYKKQTPNFEYVFGPKRRGKWRKKINYPARELLTYRRYLNIKNQAPFYRERWLNFLPTTIQKLIRNVPAANSVIKSNVFESLLKMIEILTPPVKDISRQIKDYAPDVVLIAYRNLPSRALDLEYLKTAKKLSIPTVIPLLSWDTLTTKGLIQIEPDMLLVWNDEQVEEAVEHHNLPKNKIKIVGAFQFDNWLSGMKPSQNRDEFCRRYGLEPRSPIILYLGFSYSGKDVRLKNGHGPSVVETLRKSFDSSRDERLKDMQIIVRPHPMHTEAFRDMNIRGAVAIPKENTLMNTPKDYQLFYDCVHHSICGAGINTTAIIDISIQLKPAIVLHFAEYRSVQSGSHFKRFLKTGAVAVADTPEIFASTVSGFLDGKDPQKNQRIQYMRTYIRPRDIKKLAAEFAADEIESLLAKRHPVS